MKRSQKLFHAVQPTRAYFGQKDRQQLQVIRAMVADLLFPLTVIGVPTARDSRGLALSSRNSYLSSEQQEQASVISRSLQAVVNAHRAGERDSGRLEQIFREGLQSLSEAEVDRFDILDSHFSRAYAPGEAVDSGSVCVAVRYAGVRLLDGVELEMTGVS